MINLIVDAQTGEESLVEVSDLPTIEHTAEPTLEERVATTETKVASIEEVMEVIYG